MGVTLVLRNVPSAERLVFARPKDAVKLDKVIHDCWQKDNGYVCVTIERVRKPRSVGEKSQNNLFWKLVSLVAQETGDDSAKMIDTENGIKERALSRGYPYHVNKITGRCIPESTTRVSSVEMSYLIDTAYQICADLGIVIPSNLGD